MKMNETMKDNLREFYPNFLVRCEKNVFALKVLNS